MPAPQSAVVRPLPASIECLPKQVAASDPLTALLPAGTQVYLSDIGTPGADTDMLTAARRVRDAGCIPVPHLAARRIRSRHALETRIGALAEQAGVSEVLVVAGGAATPLGPYESTMDLLETGLLDRFGINDIAVAGHPEGSQNFTEASAIAALRQKQAFAERTGARLRIVTQFGFDPARALDWAKDLVEIGVDVPVHIGVAGPARLMTLVKYATLCGVANALTMLKGRTGTILSLAAGYSPDVFVLPIEQALAAQARPTITQMHVFPFGGFEKASSWLHGRGSWSFDPGVTRQRSEAHQT